MCLILVKFALKMAINGHFWGKLRFLETFSLGLEPSNHPHPPQIRVVLHPMMGCGICSRRLRACIDSGRSDYWNVRPIMLEIANFPFEKIISIEIVGAIPVRL